MPDFLQSTLRDPNYGTVRELCRAVGYGREDNDRPKAPRSISLLRDKTNEYRKQFMATYVELERFPLHYQSKEVQQCALGFLNKYARLFDNSDEAEKNGWPIYPDDNEQLVDGLAKLMCQQEFGQRRNEQTRQKKKRAREERSDHSDSSMRSSEDEYDSEQSEILPHSIKRAIHDVARQVQEERNPSDFDKARKNIDDHLDFIFPLDGIPEERTSDWVFNTKHHWPDHAKRFSWRYFHEHNLYSPRNKNTEAVNRFVEEFKRYLNIRCTGEEAVTVRKRCKKQVSVCGGTWRNDGLLKRSHAFPRKTRQFEAAWSEARQKWLDLFHDGIPPPDLKIRRSVSVDASRSEISAANKRDHAHVEELNDIYDIPLDDPPSGSTAKRARIQRFADNPSGSRTTNQEIHMLDVVDIIDLDEDTISVDAARWREQRRAPEASMNSRAPAKTQSNKISVQVENSPSASALHKPPASGHNLPHINQGRASLPLASAAARRDAKVNGGIDVSAPSDDRSRPYALSGESLNQPFSTNTALVRVSQTIPPSKPPRPQLHYIVPNSTGGLDYDDPLPRTEFVDSNLSEFFKTIARRAGEPHESLTCLTFTCNWGKRETFVVDRYRGNTHWEKIKERVKGNFMKARNSMLNRTLDFELWVECGDTTKIVEEGEEED